MSRAVLLTAKDFFPLRDDQRAMQGALQAVEDAVVAQDRGGIRQYNVQDRRPGEFEGIRVSLTAGDGLYSGMRVFGNPPHTRAFLLFEGETRALIALMDYGVLNSMRVGAIAGVAARHLAPAGARVVGLLGSGWQAKPQVAALRHALPGLERIKVFSPTRAHREAFCAEMTPWLGIPVEPVESTREALEGADVVDLCAPGHHDVREPLFEEDWVKPGALVIAMAQNQTKPEFVERCQVVALWQNIAEPPRSPYDRLIEQGKLTPENVMSLGAVIDGKASPRNDDGCSVLYHLEGGTAHDLFVATWGYEWACERGAGLPFDLSEE